MFINDIYASDQYAQTNYYIIGNSFGIILKMTGQKRGSKRDVPQWQTNIFCCLEVSSALCSSVKIKLSIKTIRPMYLSSKPPLASWSKLQVPELCSSMLDIFSTNTNISLLYSSKWVERKTHWKNNKR